MWKLQSSPFAHTVYLRPSVKTNVLLKIIYENAYNSKLKTYKIVLLYFGVQKEHVALCLFNGPGPFNA